MAYRVGEGCSQSGISMCRLGFITEDYIRASPGLVTTFWCRGAPCHSGSIGGEGAVGEGKHSQPSTEHRFNVGVQLSKTPPVIRPKNVRQRWCSPLAIGI